MSAPVTAAAMRAKLGQTPAPFAPDDDYGDDPSAGSDAGDTWPSDTPEPPGGGLDPAVGADLAASPVAAEVVAAGPMHGPGPAAPNTFLDAVSALAQVAEMIGPDLLTEGVTASVNSWDGMVEIGVPSDRPRAQEIAMRLALPESVRLVGTQNVHHYWLGTIAGHRVKVWALTGLDAEPAPGGES